MRVSLKATRSPGFGDVVIRRNLYRHRPLDHLRIVPTSPKMLTNPRRIGLFVATGRSISGMWQL
jgi:hypothetical protein